MCIPDTPSLSKVITSHRMLLKTTQELNSDVHEALNSVLLARLDLVRQALTRNEQRASKSMPASIRVSLGACFECSELGFRNTASRADKARQLPFL